ncbi:nucleoside-diphosphate-sugar epimerase [Aminobacter lissarensis]|uniref:Nucleoside-diphosphate-sugar epimerase n=2 Tax=Aminobacter carboxidus TaxID=376165 RepID=A0A8E1WJH7_9HYPH|nr:nucleoside-diphosphate-sugar epimerase [Aminobacter lissarensis]
MDLHERGDIVRSVVGEAIEKIEWHVGDISSREHVERAVAGVSTVVHLAGALGPVCERDPVLGATVNLIGTLHLFALAKERPLNIAYATTAGIFGPYSGEAPAPTTHYGAFKYASELSARVFYADHDISSVGLRPLTVYGPGRLFGSSAGPTLACRAAVTGEDYVIPFTGQTDFIYVDDVAAAFVAVVDDFPTGAHALNMTGVVADTQAFIGAIKAVKPGAKISASGSMIPIAAIRPDNGLEQLFPNLQRTSIDEGVRRTIAYYETGKVT